MLGARPISRLIRLALVLLAVVLVSSLGFSGVLAQTPPNATQGTVRLE